MKAVVLACIFVHLFLLARVNGAPQGAIIEEEKPLLSHLRQIRDEFIKNVTNIDLEKASNLQINNRTGLGGGSPLAITTVYNTLLSGIHSLYQELLNRQQAFVNILTCGNCVNEGWNAIMDVVQTVPELQWVYTPQSGSPASFFTAIHKNGTVTGIGGSVVNDRLVAEYAFGPDGIVHHLPQKHRQ